MKPSSKTVCLVLCVLTLATIPIQMVKSQNYAQYQLTINSDGSAAWKITQFTDANGAVDSWDAFQQKAFNLVDSAVNATQRDMSVDEKSLMINTTVSEHSKTTEYDFTWQNFSVVEGNDIVFGDAFQTTDFFAQLYGDASLQVNYPVDFVVKSVVPQPYSSDDTAKTFEWARTQDLSGGKTSVILTKLSQNATESATPLVTFTAIAVVASLAIVLSVGFYLFKRRKSGFAVSDAKPFIFETEEGKVVKILQAAGGTMRQSDITEQTGFSKAKTSQLLTALESRGSITRYKSGRDKIVTFNERVKSE
jgi:uncharacterized membrane protein